MAVREILHYPKHKEELRKPSRPIPEVNREVTSLIADLKETLLAHPEGIGLAAPQINRHLRAVMVRLGSSADGEASQSEPPLALLNPEIIAAGDPRLDFDGCLSFLGLYGETVRPHTTSMSWVGTKRANPCVGPLKGSTRSSSIMRSTTWMGSCSSIAPKARKTFTGWGETRVANTSAFL